MINTTINNSHQHYEQIQIFQQSNKQLKSSFIPSPQQNHQNYKYNYYNTTTTTARKHNNKFNEVFPQKLTTISRIRDKNPIINNTSKQIQTNQIQQRKYVKQQQHSQHTNSKIPKVLSQNVYNNNKSNESRHKTKATLYRKESHYTKIGKNSTKEIENFQFNHRGIFKENMQQQQQQQQPNQYLKQINRNEKCIEEIENEYDYIYETIPENYLLDKVNKEKYDELWMVKNNNNNNIGQKFEKDRKFTDIAKFKYNKNNNNDLKYTTDNIMSTPKYYAKIAQNITENLTTKNHSFDFAMSLNRNGGFCGALQRAPPPMPPGLVRRLSNKENYGLGKVKVMLRVADGNINDTTKHFMSVDKKKRQITLTDLSAINTTSTMSQDRALMVAAPKMFAFDGIFTTDDPQYDVCSSSLSEVIPAVLEGSDACFLTIGYPNSGQSKTMFGDLTSNNELGVISCAISWLYKGINDRRQKTGSRFSVRVSALGISARKSDSLAKDLLAAYATELDDSPGVYFREDLLGGPTELRAPTAERAALFLDAALAVRPKTDLEPAIIFTLHVYQYSLSRKGGVAGGRSRLHFIDLGGCANRNGGLPLSGIGNIILAILNGQRHLPNKDHPLTPLLKDCLGPLTCHVSILAHIKYIQAYTDALTTIQLASRIHRMRRRRQRFPISTEKNIINKNGLDPSSSDTADTVIYMGPSDDATDGEHPPLYLPSLTDRDNQCAVNKPLKLPIVEKQINIPKAGTIISNRIENRTVQLLPDPQKMDVHIFNNSASAKDSTVPKDLSLKRPAPCGSSTENQLKLFEEEQWIDGPRLSRAKIAEARHMLREINHVKNCETWIDGPKTTNVQLPKPITQSELNKLKHHSAKTLNNGKFLTIKNNNNHLVAQSYGFMDSHKKTMIRQWVENQSSHIFQPVEAQLKNFEKEISSSQSIEILNPTAQVNLVLLNSNLNQTISQSEFKGKLYSEDEDKKNLKSTDDHGPKRVNEQIYGLERSEIPSPLPLLNPLGSREVSIERVNRILSIHVSHESMEIKNTERNEMLDCGLQVSEDDIARSMHEHPLAALSNGNISTVSSFNVGDTFSDCAIGDKTRNQFDQLARLREIFTSQLAMAELIPTSQIGESGSIYSEPVFRFDTESHSVYSEPVQQPSSPRCSSCRQSLNLSKASSQTSIPSLKGIMEIANMNQFASLRHPDGASDQNLLKTKINATDINSSTLENNVETNLFSNPLAQLNISSVDAYDSGHDCSTPRTSKYSALSRRAESGYHSVATGRDSDEISLTSASISKNQQNKNTINKKKRQDKSLCNWLRSPFTCTHPETEGEISDF